MSVMTDLHKTLVPQVPNAIRELATGLVRELKKFQRIKLILFFTGARASFKSSQAEILGLAANEADDILWLDTSMALRWHREQKTRIGSVIKQYAAAIDNGLYLPGELVFVATATYIIHRIKERNGRQPRYIFLAGSPRSMQEAAPWKSTGIPQRITHLLTTRQAMFEWAAIRDLIDGTTRTDSKETALSNNWNEYTDHTVPMVRSYMRQATQTGEDLVHEIESKQHARMRTRRILERIRMPANLRSEWINNLSRPGHKACALIDKLESADTSLLAKHPTTQVEYVSPPHRVELPSIGLVHAN